MINAYMGINAYYRHKCIGIHAHISIHAHIGILYKHIMPIYLPWHKCPYRHKCLYVYLLYWHIIYAYNEDSHLLSHIQFILDPLF